MGTSLEINGEAHFANGQSSRDLGANSRNLRGGCRLRSLTQLWASRITPGLLQMRVSERPKNRIGLIS
jgi:hypothetical protein